MKFYKIEVDEKVWNYLKEYAEPFEDTPNSVLNRLLFSNSQIIQANQFEKPLNSHRPNFSPGMPKALSQTLEVIFEVKKMGRSRNDATSIVAKREGTAPQTIIDKYCRQLNKKAYEIDLLLQEHELTQFKILLERKFPKHQKIINEFFSSLNI